MNDRPKLREDLSLQEVENDVVLTDPRTGQVFLLNGTAAAIADLCDGQNTIRAIAREIVAVLPADHQQVLGDVQKTVHELGAKGLLWTGDPKFDTALEFATVARGSTNKDLQQ